MEAVTRVRDMRTRVEEFDWAATPMGPPKNWPQSLRWSVDLVLASGLPMSVRWGPELTIIYNDAYGALLGDRHPGALGKTLREVWPEIYSELGVLNLAILRGEREGFFAEDHPWLITDTASLERRGSLSATARSQWYWRRACHRLRDDGPRAQ